MVAVTGPPAQPIHALNKALCIELDVVPLVALDALNELLGHGVVNGSAAHPTVQRRAHQLGRTGPVFGLNGFDGAANLHLGRWRTWCLVGNAVTHQLPLRSTGVTRVARQTDVSQAQLQDTYRDSHFQQKAHMLQLHTPTGAARGQRQWAC
jgi:hypothetical protein